MIGERIRQRRIELKMTQEELALKVGYRSRSAINKIEKGLRDVNQTQILKLSEILDVSIPWLMGYDVPMERESEDLGRYGITPITTKRLPLLGSIACGEPVFADEDREVYIEVGTDINADFCLRAKGDSMTGARIQDGDIVFIRKQNSVLNGEIAAVLIEDEATLKRVQYDDAAGVLLLFAENPLYKTMSFTGEQLNQIRILGKAVAFQSDVR